MGKRPIRILIACGSGVATSTIAVQAVTELCKEEGIAAEITKCSLPELPSKESYTDIILTTNNYGRPVSKPILSVFGLISGINEEKIKRSIVDLCNTIELTDN